MENQDQVLFIDLARCLGFESGPLPYIRTGLGSSGSPPIDETVGTGSLQGWIIWLATDNHQNDIRTTEPSRGARTNTEE